MTHDELPGVLRQAAEIMREDGKPALRELLLAAAEEIERLRGESLVGGVRRMKTPSLVAQMREAIKAIKHAQSLLARGPLDYTLGLSAEHSEALLTRFAPLKVGERVRISKPIKCEGGWKGCDKTLAMGREGVIRDVDYHQGAFRFSWLPDQEWWRDRDGEYHECDKAAGRHHFTLKEGELESCERRLPENGPDWPPTGIGHARD